MALEFSFSSIEIANARLWKNEIAAFQNQAPPRGVLFVGSSSIALWSTLGEDFPEISVINRGFGGSQLCDSVYHFDALFLTVAPRAVVFYAGDNDLACGRKPVRIAENFQLLAELMQTHLPEIPLFFISIKPSPARWNLIEKIRATNAQIENICRRHAQLQFVDMDSVMLDENGNPRAEFYVEDELHLSPKGYAAWTGVLRPLLEPFADDALNGKIE